MNIGGFRNRPFPISRFWTSLNTCVFSPPTRAPMPCHHSLVLPCHSATASSSHPATAILHRDPADPGSPPNPVPENPVDPTAPVGLHRPAPPQPTSIITPVAHRPCRLRTPLHRSNCTDRHYLGQPPQQKVFIKILFRFEQKFIHLGLN
jgi:hypothetical protein